MSHADFLVEIYTEELPPKKLLQLAQAFQQALQTQLQKTGLGFSTTRYFATPRRLAVFVQSLAHKQDDQIIERKGPAVSAAFDAAGQPTPACLGFARSCGVLPEQLSKIKNNQGEWMAYQQKMAGQLAIELLPSLVEQALLALPIPKRMSWGQGDTLFVRPVHSIVMLYGEEVVPATLLGCKAGRVTYGHRFLAPQPITLSHPAHYEAALAKAYVMADFAKRRQTIIENSRACLAQTKGESGQVLFISDELIDEITGLVEWPVPLLGRFDEEFLDLPQEVLLSYMRDHQRYFAVTGPTGLLLAYFILISNIESREPVRVIAGNERVLQARLADANFFYIADKKQSLNSRVENLHKIIFQAKLGTLFDKTQRLIALSRWLAPQLNLDVDSAARAAHLAKTDLTTHMVLEFPELQGIMGYYYALHDGEKREVALAIKEHYLPRSSGGDLPETALGQMLALVDRMDTLTGFFGIHEIPTGDKDPFGLRRAAFGILRILIAGQLDLDLQQAFEQAIAAYPDQLTVKAPLLCKELMNFIQERLRSWYQEQGIDADVFIASAATGIANPWDLHRRIQAVHAFKHQSEAQALSIANKRVSQILTKYKDPIAATAINPAHFEMAEEQELAQQLELKMKLLPPLCQARDYTAILMHLAALRPAIDHFFDRVLVMTEDQTKRENRLLLLRQLRSLFLQVADIALLQLE